ncbi:asparagine synthase (glutamine-hydrolyzing) [Spongiactinospora sp. 9N601]|uniref:asparagine synthase (glutamine-hydrolyzing) n=1 Tax=Spongiactinospora sp. 9N601 TaxID=3375149 RepID=UPI00378C1866
MCGLAGFVDMREGPEAGGPAAGHPADEAILDAMAATLAHRGPDAAGRFLAAGIGLGFRRLSIVDLTGGMQPLRNEDGSVVLVCNGEIFNYRELRSALRSRGHVFTTDGDVEVIVHLYEEKGPGLLHDLRGQFAFALYDRTRRRLLLARDHLGVLPLFYTRTPDQLVFGSEIKAVLAHRGVPRAVDLTGLDQILTFPGLAGPRTMFAGVRSLEAGHYLLVEDGQTRDARYWDLDYPLLGQQSPDEDVERRTEELRELLTTSVVRRLRADVPVGLYLSGGLDSSLIAALAAQAEPGTGRHSFSIAFPERHLDESRYQRLVAEKIATDHHEIITGPADLSARFTRMVWHAEAPVKETYNTCSLALSEAARAAGVKVVLAGEGADELFGGYPGYRFDQAGLAGAGREHGPDAVLERQARQRLWGDPHLYYERDYHQWSRTRRELYAPGVAETFPDFDCTGFPPVDPDMLRGRHPLHQRSYLDVKLRLTDHLLGDHGDRMGMANGVEVRYPFLDLDVVEFATSVPQHLAAPGLTEKYLLKRVADGLVPADISQRQKFGFRAPASPTLLREGAEWVNDMLSPARVRRQGYFAPEVIEHLRARSLRREHDLHPHLEDDVLLVALSFGVLLDTFGLPNHT